MYICFRLENNCVGLPSLWFVEKCKRSSMERSAQLIIYINTCVLWNMVCIWWVDAIFSSVSVTKAVKLDIGRFWCIFIYEYSSSSCLYLSIPSNYYIFAHIKSVLFFWGEIGTWAIVVTDLPLLKHNISDTNSSWYWLNDCICDFLIVSHASLVAMPFILPLNWHG
jgi:hypothetical protein